MPQITTMHIFLNLSLMLMSFSVKKKQLIDSFYYVSMTVTLKGVLRFYLQPLKHQIQGSPV